MTLSSDDVPMRVEISGNAIRCSSRFHTPQLEIAATPTLFQKSWNKNTPARLYVDECNRS
jgi:hypothetical protein